MLFSSLVFIFGFLPLTLVAVYLAMKAYGQRLAMLVLLVASLIFYAWQTPAYIFLIGISVCINFGLGQYILRRGSKAVCAFGVGFNLALLGWFKYIGLFSSTFSELAKLDVSVNGVVLPLAISFFTFQQIAFLADCLKSDSNKYGFLDYALFVTFFPQLIAGPIVHHKELTPQFNGANFARFSSEHILAGLFLFSIGLAKKILIADGLAPLADGVYEAASVGHLLNSFDAWIGVLAYSFQIYFDFSGYSDMALGLALLLGITLPMNFRSPYKARNIIDFWRRWHITLSRFLRDYLYFPLGGNRLGGLIRYRNLFIVMLLGGLWHGAAWTFVVWGGLHGLYLCVNHAWIKIQAGKVAFSPLVGTLITFAATSLAWVFFRADSFDAAFVMLASLIGLGDRVPSVMTQQMLYSLPILITAAVGTWLFPNALEMLERFKVAIAASNSTGVRPGLRHVDVLGSENRIVLATACLGILAAVTIFVLIANGPYEFIYFQF